jgi:hypothetical protein
MKPAIDGIRPPCRWSKETISEDRIAFTQEERPLTLVAELVEESVMIPRACIGLFWQIRFEKRVGEAKRETTTHRVVRKSLQPVTDSRVSRPFGTVRNPRTGRKL